MKSRLAIYQLAEHHKLDASALRRLLDLSAVRAEPPTLLSTLARAVAILAAILTGLGLVFWIAANWDAFGRAGHFALLQLVLAGVCAGAVLRPALRTPLCILALVAIGALFAYFGQTYQTGADAWQLFALWAALSLPLGLTVRSDAWWTAWTLVAMTAIGLWIHTHAGGGWRGQPAELLVFAAGWMAALLVTFALGPTLRRYSGAGLWASRLGVTLSAMLITFFSITGLFAPRFELHYFFGLALLAGAAFVSNKTRMFDIYNVSAIGLGLNALLFGGLARLLFDGGGGDQVGKLLALGLLAAAMLAGTVKLILHLVRQHNLQGESA